MLEATKRPFKRLTKCSRNNLIFFVLKYVCHWIQIIKINPLCIFYTTIIQVLRALGLLRLGKSDECESILESVRTEVPVDEPTLQAMTIAYREMHQSI